VLTDPDSAQLDIAEPLPDDAPDELALAYEQAVLSHARTELLGRADKWASIPTHRAKRVRDVGLKGHRPHAQLIVTYTRVHAPPIEEALTTEIWDETLAGYQAGTREPVIGVISYLIDEIQST